MQKIFSFSSFLLRFKEHVSSTPRMPYGEHKTTTFLLIDFHQLIKLYNFRIFAKQLTTIDRIEFSSTRKNNTSRREERISLFKNRHRE